MQQETQNPEASNKYIFKGFQLTEANFKHLQEISQGNMSFTVRKLIEDAWNAMQAKETK